MRKKKKSLGARTFVYPTPVMLVGTYDDHGRPNLMSVAWGGVCCSKPPCVSISVRKATYTYGNLVRGQAFTVAIPSEEQTREADYLGIYSGKDEDKFGALGLTARKSKLVNAPYAEEFPLLLECQVRHTLEVGLHIMFVGEVLDAKADPGILDGDGKPDLALLKPLAYAPINRVYHSTGPRVAKAFSVGRK